MRKIERERKREKDRETFHVLVVEKRSSMFWKKERERERKIFSYRSGKIPLRAATTF